MSVTQWIVFGIALALFLFYMYVLFRMIVWVVDVAFMFMGWSNGNRDKKKK